MRIFALVGLFVLTIVAASSSQVSAEAPDFLQVNKSVVEATQPAILATLDKPPEIPAAPVPAEQPAKIEKYKVAENDSLSVIAEHHRTTWKRLYDKNETIQHPDNIKVGEELTIPRADEVLKERPLPEPPQEAEVQPEPAAPRRAPARNRQPAKPAAPKPAPKPAAQPRGTSSGNTYTAGYCTWYVKNRRPDLPNNLGNADTWVARAAAQGLPTGSAPRAGAVGQQGMHVVYVESVNGDGTVTISEMNYRGLYVISRRTVAASTFRYIY